MNCFFSPRLTLNFPNIYGAGTVRRNCENVNKNNGTENKTRIENKNQVGLAQRKVSLTNETLTITSPNFISYLSFFFFFLLHYDLFFYSNQLIFFSCLSFFTFFLSVPTFFLTVPLLWRGVVGAEVGDLGGARSKQFAYQEFAPFRYQGKAIYCIPDPTIQRLSCMTISWYIILDGFYKFT